MRALHLVLLSAGSAIACSFVDCLTSFPEVKPKGAAGDSGVDDSSSGGVSGSGGASGASGSGGDTGSPCGAGLKLCGEVCESTDNPAVGCGSASCEPCTTSGEIAVCVGEACVLKTCSDGKVDCDGFASNGCEADPPCQPISLAPGQRNPWSIRVDSTHAYWTSSSGAAGLSRVAHTVSGASVEVLYGFPGEGDLVLDPQYVYWVNDVNEQVLRLSKKNPEPQPVVLGSGVNPHGIAIDDEYVYWSNTGTETDPYTSTDGTIVRAPKLNPGKSEVLAQNLPTPFMLVLDDTHVYFTSLEAGSVFRVLKGGGPAEKLALGTATPALYRGWGIRIDQTFAYFRDDIYLRKVPKDAVVNGGTDQSVILAGSTAEPQSNGRFVALFGTTLGWTSIEPSGFVRLGSTATLPGTPGQDFASGPWAVHGIEIDDRFVYWTDWGSEAGTEAGINDGAIYKKRWATQ